MSFWIVPPSFCGRHALFLGGDDIERHDRQHRAVHGHRHGHLVERDAGEQRPHVVDRVDRDARHADVAGDARMVAVVAAVGGEIEGDREALLPAGEIAAVERVGVFRGGEAGVLPDGPRLRHVHGRVGAAQIRRDAGIGVEEVEAGEIVRPVGGLHRDAFRREPGLAAAGCRGGGGAAKSTLAKSGMRLIVWPKVPSFESSLGARSRRANLSSRILQDIECHLVPEICPKYIA